ncbi:MAG TPA: molybdopterin-dependent oxidoreductase [Acidimicrobiales bacterium]|nr:molybdopterin-dependent oxidoreductase [Acidimicrobiales bacterium]
MGTHLHTCTLCEAMCGLEITVTDGRVSLVRADREDVWSKGYLCPKGTTLGKLHDDPDRIRQPMVRDGDRWREVTWDEAFARCEELLRPVIETYGIGAVTAFIGNPTAHNFSLGRYVGVLIGMSGIPMIYSSGTVDQWPKNLSSQLLYGGMWTFPVPDVPRTDLWIVMGANPHASQGSLLACPDLLGEIDRIRERGGRTVVVDPRRTGTADRADEWVPIVPGTDAALLLAMVNVLFAEGRVDLGGLAPLVDGVETVRALAQPFTPEAVAAATGIPPEKTRELARDLATTERAVLYGRIGLCNQEFGSLASWLVDVVNILTGHFDTPGGLMFPKPVAWGLNSLPRPDLAEAFAGRWRSRVRGAPEVLGQVPVSCLAEEIDTPGEGQLHALITVAGNPVISAPGAGRLDRALPLLDCMISVDNWLNETTRHADVLLPGLSPLEQPHFDDLLWSLAVRSAAKWSDPVFPPEEGRPHGWEILIRLAAICAGSPAAAVDVTAIDDGFFSTLCQAKGIDPAVALACYDHGGPERLCDLSVRTGPWGDRYGEVPGGLTLEAIKQQPHGIDLGPMVPRITEVLQTASGRLDLAPPYLTADLPRLQARLARPPEQLVLVSRRHVRSKNSWMHNVDVLVKGKDRCTLLINPLDADRHGVKDGAAARVATETGTVEVPVEVSDEMMPGVVCLPHGWGHDKPGTRLSVARDHPGVNNNLLAPPEFVDAISGNAAVNGIPVEVSPA